MINRKKKNDNGNTEETEVKFHFPDLPDISRVP